MDTNLTREDIVNYVTRNLERGFRNEPEREARLAMIKEIVRVLPDAYLIGFMQSFQIMNRDLPQGEDEK